MIISFQMGDSYNSGSQLGAPVAKEPPLLTHRTWNFPCNLLDLGALRRLPLIAEEAVKTAGSRFAPRAFLCTVRYIPIEKKYKERAKKTAFYRQGGTR